jgi:hypothetical protein
LELQLTQNEEAAMSQRIDQFCEDLRTKLTNIESGMNALKSKIGSEARFAEQEVRKHLDKVKTYIVQQRPKIAAAQAEMTKWADEQEAATDKKIAEWKAKHEINRLKTRADMAERYATAAAAVAAAAVDEAEQAALEAWLARQDAESARSK